MNTVDTCRHYFAYGSNMNPARMRVRGLAFDEVLAGRVDDFELVFNKRSTKVTGAAAANIIASLDGRVEGVLYRLVSGVEIQKMDPFERYPEDYDRQTLMVNTGSGLTAAWVYLANPSATAPGLRPARWYLNHLMAGEEFLSPDYARALRAVHCLENSDVEP